MELLIIKIYEYVFFNITPKENFQGIDVKINRKLEQLLIQKSVKNI